MSKKSKKIGKTPDVKSKSVKSKSVKTKAAKTGAPKTKKMSLKIESEKIEELFQEKMLDISQSNKEKISFEEIECTALKDLISGKLTVNVAVFGLAGTSTKRDIIRDKSGVVNCLKNIKIDDMTFVFQKYVDINSNDYLLIYEMA